MTNKITVICPVYNEESYIKDVLEFCVKSEPKNKEIIFIDGASEDKTVNIIREYQAIYDNINLYHNPDRYVPFALNKALKYAKTNLIVRIDAHTKYADDYFLTILKTFDEIDADIVGGPYRIAYKNQFQKVVGIAISSKVGVGGSKVHDISFRGYVDSVAYGAWKKGLFDDIGYFDERLMRNQDDELHYRAKSKGKKIFLNPDIKLWYYPRETYSSLFRQYYQYGLFKPLVIRKVKSEIKLRHIIPLLFVIYLFVLPISIMLFSIYLVIPLLIYLVLILGFSLIQKEINFLDKMKLVIITFLIHFGYGLGFLLGIKKLFK
ncbi:glycosyltransferase family 2 protein [Gracilimonas tropica]|uniref:glycosyltransferase family 2 protein n=1 Tax=Gracilimonas tropica TaxID=454600 RepID=UPI00036E4371|nr:glycosyltransferase family 2 protein [Gracilimonas tropica]